MGFLVCLHCCWNKLQWRQFQMLTIYSLTLNLGTRLVALSFGSLCLTPKIHTCSVCSQQMDFIFSIFLLLLSTQYCLFNIFKERVNVCVWERDRKKMKEMDEFRTVHFRLFPFCRWKSSLSANGLNWRRINDKNIHTHSKLRVQKAEEKTPSEITYVYLLLASAKKNHATRRERREMEKQVEKEEAAKVTTENWYKNVERMEWKWRKCFKRVDILFHLFFSSYFLQQWHWFSCELVCICAISSNLPRRWIIFSIIFFCFYLLFHPLLPYPLMA